MAMSLTPPIQTHYDGSFDSVKGESWINHRGTRDCRDKKQALIPKMILAGAVGFEPTNNGVKVRCVTASPHPSVGGAANLPIKRKNGVSEGTRTLGLQSHNLTR